MYTGLPSLAIRSTGTIAPAAIDWATRVIANGGTYSPSTLVAVSNFYFQCVIAGIWDKLNRVNLFCGDSLTACLVPLKVGAGSATDTNVNFVAGDYTEAAGLTGNGSSKYVRTGLIPSASLTANSTHLSLYNRASAINGPAVMGVSSDGSGNQLSIFAPFTDGIAYSAAYRDNPGGGLLASPSPIATPYGFIVASRTSSSAHSIYRNGGVLATNATIAGSLPTLEIFVGARNTNGAASLFCGMPLAGYSIGAGLTAGEVATYNTIMEQFQDSLGRGVQ